MKKISFSRPYQHEESYPNIFAWIFAKIRKASHVLVACWQVVQTLQTPLGKKKNNLLSLINQILKMKSASMISFRVPLPHHFFFFFFG
jgi:hypothetical protein